MNFWFQVLLVLWPMYLANSCAMLFGGKTPLDLNAKAWDGERFLGKGKTFTMKISEKVRVNDALYLLVEKR